MQLRTQVLLDFPTRNDQRTHSLTERYSWILLRQINMSSLENLNPPHEAPRMLGLNTSWLMPEPPLGRHQTGRVKYVRDKWKQDIAKWWRRSWRDTVSRKRRKGRMCVCWATHEVRKSSKTWCSFWGFGRGSFPHLINMSDSEKEKFTFRFIIFLSHFVLPLSERLKICTIFTRKEEVNYASR